MIEPEDDGCGDADGGHEGVGVAVVSRMDAASVFEFSEHVLDLVAFAIEGPIVRDMQLSIGL